ncbi:MAG TPA: sporulation protein [Pilimelia sp.]|nr:sporulation protein [Pilimelia sp.]
MVFKKLLGAFGVGGPSVDTVLSNPNTRPGLALDGQVLVQGGDHDVTIEGINLGLVTRVEVEGGDTEFDTTVEFQRLTVSGRFSLAAGEKRAIPFQFPVPWEAPVTDVYGQRLHGMTMGLRTELAVARAVDKGDLDPVAVHPLPAQEAVLAALARLGFRFKGADLEHGHIRGVPQTLPFYQEIEYFAAPQYAHALNELELTFVASPHTVDVILEVDKRGGLFTGGHDVFHHFQVPHAGAEHTDWAARIDGWLQQAVLPYAGGHGGPGYGHHPAGPGHHGGHHGGVGAGAAVAGVGAGLVGGYLAAEMLDDVFDGGDDEG